MRFGQIRYTECGYKIGSSTYQLIHPVILPRYSLILLILLAICVGISLPSLAVIAQSVQTESQAVETDAVYLLDVTGSMVGAGGHPAILKQVLDELVADIERFDRGTFTLITFAGGPCDLDGMGPIKEVYTRDVDEEKDKLFFKRFLRPAEYGEFSKKPSWPGVAQARKQGQECFRPTGIYETILEGLKRLNQLQDEAGSDYASTHVQQLFVYTDGHNNVEGLGKPTFDDVLNKLKERHFEMDDRFRYKRYLFSDKSQAIEQTEKECEKIKEAGAEDFAKNVSTPDISQLVVLDLDRRVLGFPNLWTSDTAQGDARTVALNGIRVFYDRSKEEILKGGKLVIPRIKPEDFGLPGDVTINVRTEPAELKFPVKQFDLYITVKPFSRFKAFLREAQKRSIQGSLRLRFVKEGETGGGTSATQKTACRIGTRTEPLVDWKQPSIPVDLPYVRPELRVNWQADRGKAFSLTLDPNRVFTDSSPEVKRVRVNYNETHFKLVDDRGRRHGADEQFSLQDIRKLTLKIRQDLAPGTYTGSIQLAPMLEDVKVNDASSFEQTYEFSVLGFDRETFSFPNLRVPPSEGAVNERTVALDVQLLSPIDQGTITIQPVGFKVAQEGVGVEVEPKTVELPADESLTIKLTFRPYGLLKELKPSLNRDPVDGYLQIGVSGTDPGHPAAIRPNPRVPVALEYRDLFIDVACPVKRLTAQEPPGTALGQGAEALRLNFSYSEDLEPSQRKVRVSYNTDHFYLTDRQDQRLSVNAFDGSRLKLKAPSELPAGVYQGTFNVEPMDSAVKLTGCADFPLQYAFSIPHVIRFPSETPKISFPNIWVSGQATEDGNARRVGVDGIRMGNLPDWGEITLHPSGFGLPADASVELTPKKLQPPFPKAFDLQLTVHGISALRGTDMSRVKGKIRFDFTPEASERGIVRLERSALPVAVDLERPAVQLTVNGSTPASRLDLGQLVTGDPAFSLQFEGNEPFMRLPEEERRLTVEDEGGYLADESGTPMEGFDFVLTGSRKLNLEVGSGLTPDSEYRGKLKVASVSETVELNGRSRSQTVAYRIRYPALRLSVTESRGIEEGATVSTGDRIATYTVKPNEALLKDPRPIRIRISKPLVLVDPGGTAINSEATIMPSETGKLQLRVDSDREIPPISQFYEREVTFAVPEGVSINGGSSNRQIRFAYAFNIVGRLVGVFKGVGGGALVLGIIAALFVAGQYAWAEGLPFVAAAAEVLDKKGLAKTYAVPLVLVALGGILLVVGYWVV